MVMGSCNPNKNTPATRQYQAFLTRYNIHYNGDKHYKETLEDMEKGYQDDYEELVYVHPAETRGLEGNVPQPQGDFTRSIEKAEKAIQLHSIKKAPRGRIKSAEDREWKSRGEYNPFLHNSWMLMGKSLYMQGDFQKAATIFMFMSRHFRWLPETVLEAKIWEARCFCALGWLYEAEDALDGITEKELTSKELKRQYWIAESSLQVRRRNYAEAADGLEKAIAVSSGAQKIRLRYLQAQVWTRMGENEKAYKAFSKIAGNVMIDYRTRINARIAMSAVTPPGGVKKELASLQKQTRYESNAEYLDRIYFAIGNLYLVEGDTTKALEAYEKAASIGETQGNGQGQSELAIGKIYYLRGEYAKAQPHYATAVSLLPETFPDITEIKRRSDILDRYAVYANNVELQDSLLKLAEMPEEERMAVCEALAAKYREEQKKLKDQELREEFMAENAGNNVNSGAASQPTVMTMADQDAAWYFYNAQTVRNGRTQFQQTWGNRRLEDNWRRRDKTQFSFDTPDQETEDTEEGEEKEEGDDIEKEEESASSEAANDPANAEYYLRDIPLTDEQKSVAQEIIIDGLYNMGVILKNDIRDLPRAIEMFNRLLERFPDNIFRLDALYNLYLIYAQEDELDQAENMRLRIVDEFADSPLGKAMRSPDYFQRLKKQVEIQDSLYVEAYQAYLDNSNAKVHSIVEVMKEDYPTSQLMPKFLFIDALAYATDGDREKFKAGISELLARFPDTDLTPVASGMLTNLNAGMKLGENNSNLRGMIWDIKVGGETSTAISSEDVEGVEFELDERSPQLYILLFPTDEVSANQLLYDIGRHNFETFMARDFDIDIVESGGTGLLIVSGLSNRPEAERYEQLLQNDERVVLPPSVRRLMISEKDFKTLTDKGMRLSDYLRYVEKTDYEEAQKQVLDEDVYEIDPLENADAEDATDM